MIARYPGRLRAYARVREDPIAFLTELASFSDFVRFDVLFYRMYLVNDPELVREALVELSEDLVIEGGASTGLARLIGRGILTNRGDAWRKSRTSLQPLFHDAGAHVAAIATRVQESIDRWLTLPQPLALSRELLALSYRIKCSTLFGALPEFDEALQFADAIRVLQLEGMQRFLAGHDVLPWIPARLNRRVEPAKSLLFRLAQSLADRGAPPRDEVLSLLFAGTESPVNTLCFALELLEQNPEWHERLRPCAPEDVERFDPLAQVLAESIRLYPAGWAFERRAARDVTLGGERIARGSRLLFSPFVMHRNPRFWREPERFDPARFSRGANAADGVPKYAYIPFGAGPRSCIGGRLALYEMRIALGMIAAQCEWKTQTPLRAEGSFKLRLAQPHVVTLCARTPRTPGASGTAASA